MVKREKASPRRRAGEAVVERASPADPAKARGAARARTGDRRYRVIVESAIDFAIVATDREGRITDWNAGAERVLGWSAPEMLGVPVERFFTPEDRTEGRPAQEMAGALADGRATDERWHLRRDGTRFWASGEMMPLRSEDGAHLGFVKILRDRTPQHEFGLALHRTVARYQALAATQRAVDAAGGDLAAVMRAVVEGALAAAGEADGAVIEMREGDEIVYSAAAGTSAAHVGLRLAVGGSFSGQCMIEGRPLVCADSEADARVDQAACRRVGARAMLAVPVPHHGRFVGVLKLHAARPGAFTEADVPAAQLLVGALSAGLAGHAEAEAVGALRASEERLRIAQEAGGVGTFEWDVAAGTIAMSPTFRQLWGVSEAVLPLATLGDLILAQDRPRVGSLHEDAGANALAYTEYRIRRPDTGEVRWIARRGEVLTDADGRPARGFGVVYDVTERKRGEAHQTMLLQELNHRVKNTLATVQALAAQSARGAATPKAVQDALMPRLVALSRAHDILTAENWEGADLREIVAAAVALHAGGASDRFVTRGPSVRLPPRVALALAMAFHELGTNAVKYGALSNDAGRVEIAWSVTDEDEPRLTLDWRERDGPPVTPPARKGFGSRLVERSLAAELGGEVRLRYEAAGVVCTASVPLAVDPSTG